jgi:prepilin-type N-terminal cleavage/methylation domain-containing protein
VNLQTLLNWRSHCPRRGFTLIELCLGLIIVAMVMSALAAFALAVSNCWKYSDASEASAISGNQAVIRLQRRLHDAKRVGYCRPAPQAALVYWTGDADGDGRMQFSELAMIRFDETEHTLELRQAVVALGDSDATVTFAELSDASIIQRVQDSSSAVPLVQHVTDASITVEHANDPSVAPTVQVALVLPSLSPAQPTTTQLVAATLRGPAPAQ